MREDLLHGRQAEGPQLQQYSRKALPLPPVPPRVPIQEKMTAPAKKQFTPLSTENCSECGKTFRHRSVLELHMRIHSKDKPYQCKVCGKGFRFSSYLQQHLIIHTGKKPYKCPDCGKDFAFLQNMRTHQKLHQEKPFRVGVFCCRDCGEAFREEAAYLEHRQQHPQENMYLNEQSDELRDAEKDSETPLFCTICSLSFVELSEFHSHMKETHDQRSQEDQPTKSVFNDLEDVKKKSFQCESCGRNYSRASALDAHRRCHEGKLVKSKNRSSRDATQTGESVLESNLSENQTENCPEKCHKCSCGKSFSALMRLKTHQRFSRNSQCSPEEMIPKPKKSSSEFYCSECQKGFSGHIALFNHQRWHANHSDDCAQRFPCEECGKVFMTLTASALHSHELLHTDVYKETEEAAQRSSS
uniref:C2H2-type domain-containing protein n=1 Tax=Amphiprion ocellaris TaxID=80972 RepID=A0AAQ5Y7W6_AMPOC